MKIYESISAIMKDVEAIKKEKKNQQQGYLFRGIDDMYNALHTSFKNNEVFITSNVISSIREERQTKSGGTLIYTIAKCEFTFNAKDGTKVSSIIEGEAMDSGDKSTNKAMSTALKYALMQMFLIPTIDIVDSDNDTYHPTPKKPYITDKQLLQAIKRITEGEMEVGQKCLDNFNLTEDQRKAIENAMNAFHNVVNDTE